VQAVTDRMELQFGDLAFEQCYIIHIYSTSEVHGLVSSNGTAE
jgi:hypothetical protein